MNYISCESAAKKIGVSTRRIQQMCKQKEIVGAIKDGRNWLIPDNAILSPKKPLPIGVSDFKSATTNYYYVDKTLLIRDFLNAIPMVSLFTRPRRFGKTLNMDMLRVFFEKTPEDTSIYFKDKYIWQCGDYYTKHQGQYPVIFLSFKDVKCSSWQETFQKISKLISLEFMRHNELECSSVLSSYEKEQYHRFASENINEVDCQWGFNFYLYYFTNIMIKSVSLLLMNMIRPFNKVIFVIFIMKLLILCAIFFSGGLKDYPHLAFGFLTGILRVTKESIFSGMNNLKTNSILDNNYSSYFGFTNEEVRDMLAYYDYEDKYQEICEWYDGYRFGNSEIFNPWSVINYISDQCFPKAFWQSTGSNDIIGEIIGTATPEINENLYKLFCGNTVTTYVDTSVIYPEVQSNPNSIYSFLLVAGYLKVAEIYPQNDGNYMCYVAIPNKEILYAYEKEVLNRTNQNNVSISIHQAIFSKDTSKLQSLLEDFMLKSISTMDGASEAFYHGMMLGLCAVLGSQFKVRSNRESGLGRFDIELLPMVKGIPGFIFEFKHTKDINVDLDSLANSALKQIEDMKYDTELNDFGVEDIVKIGIAFRQKSAVVKRE